MTAPDDPATPHDPATPDATSGSGAGRRLLDFGALAGRLRVATGVLGALAIAACVADGLVNGLTFALMARWAAVFVAALAVVAGLLVAVHAAGGARTARQRGEPLADEDAGLVPPRPRDPR